MIQLSLSLLYNSTGGVFRIPSAYASVVAKIITGNKYILCELISTFSPFGSKKKFLCHIHTAKILPKMNLLSWANKSPMKQLVDLQVLHSYFRAWALSKSRKILLFPEAAIIFEEKICVTSMLKIEVVKISYRVS